MHTTLTDLGVAAGLKNALTLPLLPLLAQAAYRGAVSLVWGPGEYRSVAEPEPHLLVGAGTVTQCSSGSDGSGSDGSGSDGSGSDNGITRS
jgi:hypothetical protein